MRRMFAKKKGILLFLHVPKAAGSSLLETIKQNYSSREIFEVDGSNISKSREIIENYSSLKKSKIGLVYGHMPYGWHEMFPRRKYEYITMLRDPVDRIVSHYYFVLRTPNHYLYEQVVTHKMCLSDYVNDGISPELDNGQLRQLYGLEFFQKPFDFGSVPFGSCTNEMLNHVKKRLVEEFTCVSLMENMNESVASLSQKYRWKNKDIVHKNKTNGRPTVQDLAMNIRLSIEERNQLDIQLYKFVCENRELWN